MKRKNNFQKLWYQSTFILLCIVPIFFTLYANRPSEYYFLFLYPFLLVVIVDTFITFKKYVVFYIIALVLAIFSMKDLRTNMQENRSGLFYKEALVTGLKKQLEDKKFNISFEGPPNTDTGFKYLLDIYNIIPSNNPSDPLVHVHQPGKNTDVIFGNFGVMIPKELK